MGALAGIALKAARGAPMIELDTTQLSVERGIEGDCRGIVEPGARGGRQVTVMAMQDWIAATAEIGRAVRWSLRRANLLVNGVAMPRRPGARLRVGTALLEVTGECHPCFKMEWVAPGLEAALMPEWRGGVCARVIGDGAIRIGDPVTVEG